MRMGSRVKSRDQNRPPKSPRPSAAKTARDPRVTLKTAPTKEHKHGWKASWCCECSAWYPYCNLNNHFCVNPKCNHIQYVDCEVASSWDRGAERVTVAKAQGIFKSICCSCDSEHVGTMLTQDNCLGECEHVWCGDCRVYTGDDAEDSVAVDDAEMEFSVCCKCQTYHGESLVLCEETKMCEGVTCKHRACSECYVRVQKKDGYWGTMKASFARAWNLIA